MNQTPPATAFAFPPAGRSGHHRCGTPPAWRHGRMAGAAFALAALLPPAAAAQDPGALPEGGRVVAGEASLARQAKTLTVTQRSQRAILEWRSFDIGSEASVQFLQPSASAVALNRVLDGDASRIAGQLRANGQVYLVNGAGVLFAPGARIDVGRLVTSSLDIADGDFMAGYDRFPSDTGANWLKPGIAQAGDDPAPRPLPHGPAPAEDDDASGGDSGGSGRRLTLDAGADGHLRIGIPAADVQALVDSGALVEDEYGLALAEHGDAAVVEGAVAGDGTPQAAAAAVREGRLLLLADAGAPQAMQAPRPPRPSASASAAAHAQAGTPAIAGAD
ncbi:filamentous hemagglutinin N-terminal domain-containing protein [Pseudoxanthomonas jiangsuensis]|uniref:two-partner secretion domain-containing protein n=1 Tax=Pseudoxanthomonas jiangsuensis TaxID=619688 RepID=UPI001390A9EA|nr:filamentous hemagglutinin N-terminal domain-containing protein [Pseudoxanthomonas jiangsuensis]